MQILLIILVALGVLFALFLLIAAFTKKGYSIERSIVINKPTEEVFNYVRFLRNQDYFSKWVMTDPQMKKSFQGTDGTIGFIYAWDGNKKAGKGEQEIIGIEPGKIWMWNAGLKNLSRQSHILRFLFLQQEIITRN